VIIIYRVERERVDKMHNYPHHPHSIIILAIDIGKRESNTLALLERA
jgi:hypothetical protein